MLTRIIFARCDGFKRVLFANRHCAVRFYFEGFPFKHFGTGTTVTFLVVHNVID